jgi:hypothetical protein
MNSQLNQLPTQTPPPWIPPPPPKPKVIECYPNGVARESQTPRTASQLELHPRDVVLFAPLSRLAAPQRATIAVRCVFSFGGSGEGVSK